MRIANHILFFLFVCLVIFSCTKQVDYTSDIKSLKESVTILQKRSDSLANALSGTNSNLLIVSKQVDSIKVQLASILISITSLSNQLNTVNANIASINAQIALLNQQYADLLAKLTKILLQLAVTPTTLTSGLIAYFPFDGNIRDSSGNSNHGTSIGTIDYTLDRNNKSLSSLSLGNGRVTTNTFMFNFQYPDSFSLSFWVLDNGSSSGRLISTENPEGNFRISSLGGGRHSYILGNGGIADTIQLNTWTHIVLAYSNRSMSLYKNGVLKNTITLTSTETIRYGTPFTIGAKAASAFDTWNGRIDELRIYNRALAKAEVEYLHIN